jgi:hypothetical protein
MRNWHGNLSPFGVWHTGRRRDLLSATAIARLLFSDNEPGFFYDFDDWSTLFQDTAGTQPVTAANQGVALALDKSQGLELGPELVTNGTFDTDTDWVKNPGVTISGGEAVLSGPTGNPVLSQNGVFSAGKFYRVTFTVSGHVSGTASIRCYGTGGNEVIASASANGVVSVVYFSRADATGLIGFAGTSLTMNIDNISVRELKGNHATQATTAARPLTVIHPDGGVRNLLDRSEEFDDAAWEKRNLTVTDIDTITDISVGTATLMRVFQSSVSKNATETHTFSLDVEAGTRDVIFIEIGDGGIGDRRIKFNLTTGEFIYIGAAVTSSTADSLAVGGYRISISAIPASNTAPGLSVAFGFAPNSTNSTVTTVGDGSGTLIIRNPQHELGSEATPYQKRVNFLDVTEAGKRSIRRLYFNGTSHFMQTPTITPNTDKAQVFAGVRRVGPKSQAGAILGSSRILGGSSTSLEVFTPIISDSLDRDFAILQSGGSGNGSQVGRLTTFSDPPFSVVMTTQHNLRGSNFTERMKLRLDAVDRVMDPRNNNSLDTDFLADTWNIGRRGNNTSFFNGYIDQLITRFGTNLDSGAIETTEKYVSTKVPELVAASEVTWNASTDTYTQNLVGLGR